MATQKKTARELAEMVGARITVPDITTQVHDDKSVRWVPVCTGWGDDERVRKAQRQADEIAAGLRERYDLIDVSDAALKGAPRVLLRHVEFAISLADRTFMFEIQDNELELLAENYRLVEVSMADRFDALADKIVAAAAAVAVEQPDREEITALDVMEN